MSKISAGVDGGPRSRVCARLTLSAQLNTSGIFFEKHEKCLACADPGARTPIGASGNYAINLE